MPLFSRSADGEEVDVAQQYPFRSLREDVTVAEPVQQLHLESRLFLAEVGD